MTARIRFADHLQDGDLVVIESGVGEPEDLVRALAAQVEELPDVEIFVGISYSGALTMELAERVTLSSFGAMADVGHLARADLVEILPVHYVDVARHLRHRSAGRRLVLLVQVTQTEVDGRHSFGVHVDYTAELIGDADLVIAETNDALPGTRGASAAASDIDVVVSVSRAPRQIPSGTVSEIHRSMAQHIFPLIEDNAVLQLGIGAVPAAVAGMLADKRTGLRVHTGLAGDWLVDLDASGALDPDATVVVGGAAGSEALYEFLSADPRVELRTIPMLTRPDVTASIDRFVSLNSAVQVDTTGQVNGEVIGTRYIGGVGGQVDFLRGGQLSWGGVAIIALPATAGEGKLSRIVRSLSGGTVTTGRAGVDLIVTEHGVADLRGKGMRERVEAILAIADPALRDGIV